MDVFGEITFTPWGSWLFVCIYLKHITYVDRNYINRCTSVETQYSHCVCFFKLSLTSMSDDFGVIGNE